MKKGIIKLLFRLTIWIFLLGNAVQVWRHRLAYRWGFVDCKAPEMQATAWLTLWQRGFSKTGYPQHWDTTKSVAWNREVQQIRAALNTANSDPAYRAYRRNWTRVVNYVEGPDGVIRPVPKCNLGGHGIL